MKKTGQQVAPAATAITASELDYLTRVDAKAFLTATLSGLARKPICEHAECDSLLCMTNTATSGWKMALHDRNVLRTMACGIAGLSVVGDALSAIKHSTVSVLRNEAGLAVDYEIAGDYPKFGNNDDRVDAITADLVSRFMNKIRQCPTYRNATPTQSILTITSNVVYGKKNGQHARWSQGRRAVCTGG